MRAYCVLLKDRRGERRGEERRGEEGR